MVIDTKACTPADFVVRTATNLGWLTREYTRLVDVIVGGQYEKTDPIWNYKRKLTDHYFGGNPNSPEVAERDADDLLAAVFSGASGHAS